LVRGAHISGDMLSACKDSQENYPQFDMHQGYFGRSFQAKKNLQNSIFINVTTRYQINLQHFSISSKKNFPDQIAA
jgi:hypothetical protein